MNRKWTIEERKMLVTAHKTRKEQNLARTSLLCPKCGIEKPKSDFPKKGKYRDGQERYGYCKPCHVEYQRILKLRRIYNLSETDLEKILEQQHGVCAICGKPPNKKRLHIDHSHTDGLIRGCLCWICNKLLGIAKDNPDMLRRMIAYLEQPPAVIALGNPRYGNPGRTTNKAATTRLLKKLRKQDLQQQAWGKLQDVKRESM